MRMVKGNYTFEAYRVAFQDPEFYKAFGFSLLWAVLTIIFSLLLVVPTAYWVHLKLPKARPYVEFVTLMPFVVPAVVLTFGLLRLYGRPPLVLTRTPVALIVGYIVLSLPYMYRSVDSGLRAVDIRTLTEAAQSLGAGWGTILKDVIFPNLRVALLSGIFLTFAIVMGEFTFAALLSWPAFGPYIEEIGSHAGLHTPGGFGHQLHDHMGFDHVDPVDRTRFPGYGSAAWRSTLGQRGNHGILRHQQC